MRKTLISKMKNSVWTNESQTIIIKRVDKAVFAQVEKATTTALFGDRNVSRIRSNLLQTIVTSLVRTSNEVKKQSFPTGFTLVETLFAVLIFIIISGTLYFSVTVGLKTVERQKVNFEIFQELRICLREMKQDLRSFFYVEGIELESFDGTGTSFSLISYKPDGLYKIGYYQEGSGFFRSKQRVFFKKWEKDKKDMQLADGQSYLLSSLLKRVELEYLDENKNWCSAWDVDAEYPAAVRVTFFFKQDRDEDNGYKFVEVISIPSGKKIFAGK